MSVRLATQVRSHLLRHELPISQSSVSQALAHFGQVLSKEDVAHMTSEVSSAVSGFGPLEELLAHEGVTDVLVNSPFEVYVDGANGLTKSDVTFSGEREVREFAQRLAASCGRRLDDASPWVDGLLARNIRLHAILPPISGAYTRISLRVPRTHAFTLNELATSDQQEVLQEVILQNSFCIAGPTGTGKTTLLSALLSQAPCHERLVILEDSAEINVSHPHVVSLTSRPANSDGMGMVTLRELVRQSLRMRPDRIVVGEVRGDEVVDLMLAMGSGHRGATTVHAQSAAHTITRLRTLLLIAGMKDSAIDAQIASAIGVIITVRRVGVRREIHEIFRLHHTASGLHLEPL